MKTRLPGRERPESPVLLEVCVDSIAGAHAAARGGADRIELCASLDDGGITPSAGLMDACIQGLDIPVHVLVRPRAGDFRYSPTELEVMLLDVLAARGLGAAGIVTGALGRRGDIDQKATARLVEAAGDLPVTFHRAFDLAPDPLRALEDLVSLGVSRVLSSGGPPTAARGERRLRQLVEAAAARIAVMPGGGIGAENAARILRRTGARELHASCRSRPRRAGGRGSIASPGSQHLFGKAPVATDPARVRKLVRVLRRFRAPV